MAHIPAQPEQRQASAISPTSPSASTSRRQSYSPAAYAAYFASQLTPSTSKTTPDSSAVVTSHSELSNVKRKAEEPAEDEAAKRKRIAREEDALLMREAAHRVAQAILADQLAVTYPDYQTPFKNAADVVQRLLPYHIFQQPDEDLLPSRKRSSKGKEREEEQTAALRQDVEELKGAVGLFKRRRALQDRFHSIRSREAKREARSEQLHQVQYLALDDDRRYNALLNTEIRATRDQLAQMEKDAREKKEKEQAEARKAYQAYTAQLAAQASAAAQSPTARTPANPYAAYTAAAGAVPISSAEIQRQAQPGDYRAAYLQYAQAWAAYAQAQAQAAQRAGNSSAPAAATHPAGAYALAASPPVPTTPLNAPSSSATIQSPLAATAPITPVATTAPVTPAPPKPPLLSSQPPLTMNQATATAVPTAASAVTSAQTGAAVRTVPTHPIPLQIPSSVLPAFESLGIRPVPSTDAVSTTAGPPAAVLVGSREDGQMLDITINLSLLDSAQLSGLAAVLNIVKTSGVSLQAGALGNAATTSTAPASPDMARAPNGIGQSPLTAASQSPLAGVPSNPLAAYYASYYPYYPMRTPTAAASSVQASTIAHANQTQLSSVLASGEVASPAVEPKTNGT